MRSDIKCDRCDAQFKQFRYWHDVLKCSCDSHIYFEGDKIFKIIIYIDNKRFIFDDKVGYYSAMSTDGSDKAIHFGNSIVLNFNILPNVKDNVLQTNEFITKLNNLLVLS